MFELLLRVPQDRVEAVSDALIDDLAALSVSVEDADADTAAERALDGEPGLPAPGPGWQRSLVKALYEADGTATEAATLLLAQPGAEGQTWVQADDAPRGGGGFVPGRHDPELGRDRDRLELRLGQAHPVLVGQFLH